MRRLLTALVLCWAAAAAPAQVLVGQTAGFSGPMGALVKETTDGAKLYLEHVNRHGGVQGQPVRLVSLDDRAQPSLAADNARELVRQRGVVALFLSHGAAPTEALRPLLAELKVPLVAPSSGATALHDPMHPWVFNVRATHRREAQKAVSYLTGIGMTRIALVHSDDDFGRDAAVGAAQALEQVRLAPAFVHAFDPGRPDFAPLADRVAGHDPQAIVFIGAAAAVSDGTRLLRARGSKAQVATLSNNASASFIRLLGEHARGTIVAQAVPYERALAAPLVKEAHELAVDKGLDGVTPAMLEGYLAAKVLVEGLKRAGPKATGARVRAALESMRRVDLGGLELSYGPEDHGGPGYVDLAVVGADGRFKR